MKGYEQLTHALILWLIFKSSSRFEAGIQLHNSIKSSDKRDERKKSSYCGITTSVRELSALFAKSILPIGLLTFSMSVHAVTIPRCTAPSYQGQQSIKLINNKLAWPYHLIMMVNEADDGRIAYCLTRSGMDNSGLSFGVSQLDLRTNTKAWPVLSKILESAGKVDNQLVLSNSDIEYLKLKLVGQTAPRTKDLLTQQDKVLDTLLTKVNQALKIKSSQVIIDEIHLEHLNSVLEFISKTENDLQSSNVGATALLKSSMTSNLLVLDYSNLFGGINSKLKPFMMSGSALLNNEVLRVSDSQLTVSDIIQFILKTKQASGCRSNERAEILRRIGYVLTIAKANGDQTSWTDKDRKFFTESLRPMLDDQCVSKLVDLNHFKGFIQDNF